MPRRQSILVAGLAFALLSVLCLAPRVRVAAADLPTQLSDQAFWQMVSEFSEPDGYFRSDNFLSNETTIQDVIPALTKRGSGGVYLGVGPEQNFTYIAALEPAMAFIIDIRRQNMLEHLLYKATIELSSDRADFLSRLFSRRRPAGVGADSSAATLFEAYQAVAASDTLFQANQQEVVTHLIEHHGFELGPDDEKTIKYVYEVFYRAGPELNYSFSSGGFGRGWMPTYVELMVATDEQGEQRSYLATEENFQILKKLQANNLVVPLVGDFAGPKTIRRVGQYLTEHGATVTAFYTSNVEQFLFQSDAWKRYLANVGTLPVDADSTFIRAVFNWGFSYRTRGYGRRGATLLCSIPDLVNAFNEGRINGYSDIVQLSK